MRRKLSPTNDTTYSNDAECRCNKRAYFVKGFVFAVFRQVELINQATWARIQLFSIRGSAPSNFDTITRSTSGHIGENEIRSSLFG